jgi:hypothetical protein
MKFAHLASMKRHVAWRRAPFLVCLLPSALCLLSSSCQTVGALAYKVVGPPDVQPKYVMPKEPLLIIAENYRAPAGSAIEADQLAQYVYEQLRVHDVAPLVDPTAFPDLRTRRGAVVRSMTISQIGHELGASQVLYINLTQSDVDVAQSSEMLRGEVNARVKVIDVATGNSRWPEEIADGYPIGAKIPMVREGDGVNETNVRQSLQQVLADKIGKLFYKWKPDDEVRE